MRSLYNKSSIKLYVDDMTNTVSNPSFYNIHCCDWNQGVDVQNIFPLSFRLVQRTLVEFLQIINVWPFFFFLMPGGGHCEWWVFLETERGFFQSRKF